MDNTHNQIINQAPVENQIGVNYGNIYLPPGNNTKMPDHALSASIPLRNRRFTGRDDLLNNLHSYFKQGRIASINGLGGIGKTQIALEYAYRYQEEYPYIMWGHAENEITLTKDFVEFARQLSLAQKDAEDEPAIVNSLKNWLSDNDGWMLILDNIDDVALASRFIPSGNHGHILVTTRRATTDSIAQPFPVAKMDEDEGMLFLLRRAGKLDSPDPAAIAQVNKNERDAAAQIVEEMDGLPLALDQAGAYIAEAPCSPTDYLKAYKRRRTSLLARPDAESLYPASVATTWSISFEKVEKNDPIAADLLRVLSFLAADNIPEEMLIAGATELGPQLLQLADDSTLLNDACAMLRHFSLVQRDTKQHLISIHRLVQTVLQTNMPDEIRSAWALRTLRAVTLEFLNVDYTAWEQRERLLPHALHCANSIHEYQFELPEAALLLNQIGFYLNKRAKYPQAEQLLRQALVIREHVFGPEHPDTASSLSNLAEVYVDQEQYAKAEPLLQRSLAIREQALGPEHLDTAEGLNNLALLYQYQEKYTDAEPLYKRALAILEKVHGLEHTDTATGLNNLALLYQREGKYADAEPLYQRALAISEHVCGIEHPDTTTSLVNLAGLYVQQGKYADAEPLYQRALAIDERVFGPEHPKIANIFNKLAEVYAQQGKYDDAESLYQRGLAIREQVFGPEHPSTVTSLNDLAGLYIQLGKYADAESLYRHVLAIRERVLGSEHLDTASSLNNLAGLYCQQERYAEAEPLLQRALIIDEKIYGPHHPTLAISLNNLAEVYKGQEKYAEAEPLYHRALAICEQAFDTEHPYIAAFLNNLAMLYLIQERYTDAETLLQRALAIDEKIYGPHHPEVATDLNNLAQLCVAQGKYSEAELLYQRAFIIRAKMLGLEHPYTQSLQTSYLMLQMMMQQDDKTKNKFITGS